MKKKLLALAVAGAFVAPVAMADASSVTVYGLVDVAVDFTDNGDSTANGTGVNTHKISSNAPRIGFKGSEDLGGGLKAIWQIESVIGMDNTNATITNIFGSRNTFVGLSSDNLGSLTLGRNDTPYKTSTRKMDPFGEHLADNRSLMGQGTTGFDKRFSDTVRYDSPDMSGFKVAAAYTAGAEGNTTTGANTKGKAASVSGAYSTGPFTGILAYQKNTFGDTANDGTTVTGKGNPIAIKNGSLTDEKAWKVGGGYKVDQYAVNAVYEKTTDSLGSGATGKGHKAYYVSGVFNATANDAIKLSYAKAQKRGDGNTTDTGAKQYGVGVDHSLSKRTTLYAIYTRLDNDNAVAYNLGVAADSTGYTVANGNGADPSAFSIGMKHVF